MIRVMSLNYIVRLWVCCPGQFELRPKSRKASKNHSCNDSSHQTTRKAVAITPPRVSNNGKCLPPFLQWFSVLDAAGALPTWTNFTKRPDSTLQRSRCVSRSSPRRVGGSFWNQRKFPAANSENENFIIPIHVELQHLHSSASWKTSKIWRKPFVSRAGLNPVPVRNCGLSRSSPNSQSRDRPARNKSSSSGELSPRLHSKSEGDSVPQVFMMAENLCGSWDGLSRQTCQGLVTTLSSCGTPVQVKITDFFNLIYCIWLCSTRPAFSMNV